MKTCHYCQTTEEELRPYGPGGAPLCFACMMAAPEREAEAKRQFKTAIIAAQESDPDGLGVIGGEDGPRPLKEVIGG